MKVWAADYTEYVLNAIKKNENNTERVEASLLERLTVKKLDTRMLYPNPDDEFSDSKRSSSLVRCTSHGHKKSSC